jgi:Rap1a immunity proteins
MSSSDDFQNEARRFPERLALRGMRATKKGAGGEMKTKLIISCAVVVCAVLALSRSDSAQTHHGVILFGHSGNELLKYCSEPEVRVGDVVPVEQLVRGARNNGLCGGYIAGVNDNEMSHVASGERPTYCLPPYVPLDQLTKVVRKHLEDYPAKLHLPSGLLVMEAFEQAFPCH